MGNFLVEEFFCSCSHPHMSGYDVPINLQQDKCYFRFCNILHLYEWKVLRSENGLSCIFQLHRQQFSTWSKSNRMQSVKVKETDLIWSQICPSLLQSGVRMSSVQRQWGQQLGKKEQLCTPAAAEPSKAGWYLPEDILCDFIWRNFRKENVASDERMGTGVAQTRTV